MRRLLLLGLSLGASYSCSPTPRDFDAPDNTGGQSSSGGMGGLMSNGDGDASGGGDGDGSGGGSGGTGDGSCEEACDSPLTCLNGACSLACGADEVICGEDCVDPLTDDEYCGASGECSGDEAGEVCVTGYACEDGACRLQCPVAQLACDDACINPDKDDEYCGASGDCLDDRAGEVCDGASKCIGGSCRAPDGATCTSGNDCVSGNCSTFYEDKDGDGFAAASSGVIKVCGSNSPGSQWLSQDLDCCDVATGQGVAASVNPDYSGGPSAVAATGCAKPFDYNCDGKLTPSFPIDKACSAFNSTATCPGAVASEPNPTCGEKVIVSACAWVDGACASVRGSQLDLACY